MSDQRGCDKTMDPRLYWAARRGDTSLLKLREIHNLDQQATKPTSNTALHIAVYYGHHKFVRDLCNQCPSLLTQANSNGDTPLHVAAARTQYPGIARLLVSKIRPADDIECTGATAENNKLRLRNKDNYMPLHEAVRSCNLEVAKLLTEADPGWSSHDNDADKSLLHLAARTGDKDMVNLILEMPAAYGGPKGEKALYVAAAKQHFDIVEVLAEKNIQLITGADEHGKNPLHYAAEFGNHKIVEKLILKYPSSPYNLDKNGHSPLHIATSKCHFKVIEELIKLCPDCMEQPSQEGESILHFAVKSESIRMVMYVVDILGLEGLLNQADVHGSTPFHASAKLACSRTFFYLAFDSRIDQGAVNKDKQTAFHIQDTQPRNTLFSKMSNMWVKYLARLSWVEWFKDLEKEEQSSTMIDSYKQMANTLGTVATLITTVTFASALQVPGGFTSGDESVPGMATLAGDPFFEDFMIADTIAMGLSLTAMFLILFGTYFDNKKFIIFMEAARILTFLSFLATGMAFMEGVAALLPGGVLKNQITRGYGIAVWCPYIFAVIGFLIFLYPLVVPSFLFFYQQATPHGLRKRVLSSAYARYILWL